MIIDIICRSGGPSAPPNDPENPGNLPGRWTRTDPAQAEVVVRCSERGLPICLNRTEYKPGMLAALVRGN